MATGLQFELIYLLERVGPRLGLSKSGIDFARYVLRHTQAIDWQPGNHAIVYKSVFEMARDNGISERQVYNLEQQLCEVLGVEIRATANRRRYGHRDSDGRITFAYGLDLSPLKELVPELHRQRAALDAEASQWKKLKRQVAECKRITRALADTAEHAGLSLADLQERLRLLKKRILPTAPLTWLQSLLTGLRDVQARLEAALLDWKNSAQSVEISDPSAQNFRPNKYPTDLPTDDLSSVCSVAVEHSDSSGETVITVCLPSSPDLCAPASAKVDNTVHFPSGAERVSLRAVWRASSPKFRALSGCLDAEDLSVETLQATAKRLAERHGISGFQWSEARQVVGDYAAALCMVVTDHLKHQHKVSAARAYFQAMIRRSLSGRLRIDHSIFGLLWAEGGH